MVAMVPHPCPFPSPFPFFHQVQAAEQLACTCGKRGKGEGKGHHCCLCAQNSVVWWHPHDFIYTLFLVKSVCQNMVLISFKKIVWLGKSGFSLSFILFVLS